VAPGPRLVTVTGGEPLGQEETPELVRALLAAGHEVIVETNGSLPIDPLDPASYRIIDLKSPSSGETEKIHWPNLDRLSARDEVKIVVADRKDYAWAAGLLAADARLAGVTVNLSPAHGFVAPSELASWILRDGLEVRLNVQLHRILWPEESAGR
jgi:7-carboxy-7-deazaguanine synthase